MATQQQIRLARQLLDAGKIEEASAILEAPAPKSMSAAEGTLETLLQGATIGGSDELQAAAGATFDVLKNKADATFAPERVRGQAPTSWSDAYTGRQADIDQRYRQFSKDHPYVTLAGNLLGGMGPAKLLSPLMPAASAPLLTKGGAGLATGTVLGAGAGALSAPPGQRTEGAKTGAIGGAAFGFGAPLFSAGVRAGGRKLSDVTGVTGFMKKASGGRYAPVPKSTQQAYQALLDDGYTPETAAARLKEMGPYAVIADLGANTRGLGSTVSQVPGPHKQKYERQLTTRAADALDRLLAPLNRAIGPKDGAYATKDGLIEIYQKQASPAYDAAYRQGVTNTPGMVKRLETSPTLRSAWAKVRNVVRPDVEASGGVVSKGGGGPSLDEWQLIKEEIDDRIGQAVLAGKLKTAGRLTNLKNAMLGDIDKQNPLYRDARQIFAGAKETENAIDLGMTMDRMPPGEMQRKLSTMSQAEKAAAALGFKQTLENKLGEVLMTGDATRKFFNPNMRRRLELLMGKKEAAKFLKVAEAEREMAKTYKDMYGSQTFERSAIAESLGGSDISDVVADVSTGRFGSAATGALRGLTQKILPGRKIPARVAGEVSDVLLSRDPNARRRSLEDFFNLSRRKASGTYAVPAAAITAGLLSGGG
jgi:hypothetical protein